MAIFQLGSTIAVYTAANNASESVFVCFKQIVWEPLIK